jgi:hypothetical protein
MSTYRFSCRADEDAWELRALVCGAASSTPATACFVAYISLALAGLPVVLSVMMHTKGCVDAYVAFCFYTGPVELSYSADAFMCGADGSQRVRGPNAFGIWRICPKAMRHFAASHPVSPLVHTHTCRHSHGPCAHVALRATRAVVGFDLLLCLTHPPAKLTGGVGALWLGELAFEEGGLFTWRGIWAFSYMLAECHCLH